MKDAIKALSILREAAGALAGGALGYWLVGWVIAQGFYAPLLPGALLGLGAGLFARRPSKVRGGLCALGAVALGLLTEWSYFPFRDDRSLVFFLRHLGDLKSLTIVLIGVGAALAYYLGRDAGFSMTGEPRPGRRD